MKYYLIAGEASGDLHASNLMRFLKKEDAGAQFRGFGGDKMIEQGLELVKHIREISFMGFVEVLTHLKIIFRNIDLCKKDILEYKPDVIILIDYPGFNLRIAEFAHEAGIKVFYYISPQVWAWKQSRVKKIKRVVDRMFVILPFEKEFYKGHDYAVDFVGHPMLDAIEQRSESKINFTSLNDKPIIAVLPGSRKQEISKGLPVMIEVLKQFPDYRFIIAGISSVSEELYKKYLRDLDVEIIYNQSSEILRSARAALVTSGTATLEAALIGIPEVVCYRGNPISFSIAKRIVNIKYISLVNLIMDKFVVTELIQNELTAKNLKLELEKLLNDAQYVETMLGNFGELRLKLGGTGASEKAASLMYKYLREA